MFWRKEKEEKEEKKKAGIRNKIIISFHHGASREWWIDNYEDSKKITPWIDFHKWFFSRKSDFYTMKTNKFDTTIKRSEIREFVVLLEDMS